jgi:hypothetical protein
MQRERETHLERGRGKNKTKKKKKKPRGERWGMEGEVFGHSNSSTMFENKLASISKSWRPVSFPFTSTDPFALFFSSISSSNLFFHSKNDSGVTDVPC